MGRLSFDHSRRKCTQTVPSSDHQSRDGIAKQRFSRLRRVRAQRDGYGQVEGPLNG